MVFSWRLSLLAPGILLAASCVLETFERGAPLPIDDPAPVEACPPAPLPGRPDVADDERRESFVVALRTVAWPAPLQEDGDAGQGGAMGELRPKPPQPGLDLDGRCTCASGPPLSCVPPPEVILPRLCDDPEGRDNNIGTALAPIAFFHDGDLSSALSEAAETGLWSLLVEVRDYDGGADDPHVVVSTYAPLGFGTIGGPAWDGSDAWDVRSDGFAAEGRVFAPEPFSIDPDAYVVNGRLIARLPRVDLRFETRLTRWWVRLERARLVADVVQQPNGFVLRDGQLGGLFTLPAVFQMLRAYRFGAGDKSNRLCNDGNATYKVLRGGVCKAVDARVDEGSPDVSCDAISFGMGFSADPALRGDIVDPPPIGDPCPPGFDPLDDVCPGP